MSLTRIMAVLTLFLASVGPGLADDAVKLGFITKFPVPFYTTMEDAAKACATAHPGVDIIHGQGTGATDIEGQIALIVSIVTQGVQGLAITPVDPTVAQALDKAVAAGIKVVLMDNSIPDWASQTALATTNNFEAGRIAGVEDASLAQYPAKMAELGVDALVSALGGGTVERMIDSDAALVTPANMGDFK